MTIDKTRTKAPKGTLPAFTPVPRHYNRHDGWTPERQLGFIEALADTGSVRAAANSVNMTPEGVYQLRRHPEAKEFRKAWEAALALGIQKIEDVAMDRALNGVEVPIYHFGEIVGTRKVYNDYLLMFLLRNRAPKRFGADSPARGMSAVDNMRLKRLKKAWFKEWQEEQAAAIPKGEDVRESILRKIQAIDLMNRRNASPRTLELDGRIAELQFAAEAQRRADQAAGWRRGLLYENFEEEAARLLPLAIENLREEQSQERKPRLTGPGWPDDWEERGIEWAEREKLEGTQE